MKKYSERKYKSKDMQNCTWLGKSWCITQAIYFLDIFSNFLIIVYFKSSRELIVPVSLFLSRVLTPYTKFFSIDTILCENKVWSILCVSSISSLGIVLLLLNILKSYNNAEWMLWLPIPVPVPFFPVLRLDYFYYQNFHS